MNIQTSPPTEPEKKPKTAFSTQAKALLRKNLLQQRRSICTNVFIVVTPIFFCVLLFVLQKVINNAIDKPENRCGCLCLKCCNTTDTSQAQYCRVPSQTDPCRSWETCEEYDSNKCGFEYSDPEQVAYCAVPNPSIWPPLFSVPSPAYLAHPWSPKAAILVTGQDKDVVEKMNLFPDPNVTENDIVAAQNMAAQGQAKNAIYAGALSLLGITLGSFKKYPFYAYYIEPAFMPSSNYNATLDLLVTNATSPNTVTASNLVNAFVSNTSDSEFTFSVSPVATVQVWNDSADAINQQLYCGYREARCNGISQINGYTAAYDFGTTNPTSGIFNLRMWYNSTNRYGGGGNAPTQIVRVHAQLNTAVNAFLKTAVGSAFSTGANQLARLVGIMEMPKPSTSLTLDIASLVGTLFYTWLLQLLLPVMLATLVAEKEGRLRTMMRMHGLGDGAYWTITYVWYFVVNLIYVWILIGVGTAIQLAFFTKTDYSFQFVFYLLWVACLVSFTFLLTTLFRSVRTSVVVAFLYVFASGLIGYLLLQPFVAAGRWWAVFFNIIPGFALYRGLFEIAQYAFRAAYQGTEGMTWSKLSDDGNGLPAVMGFFAAEAVIFLILAWYLDKVLPGGVGVPRHPLFFLGKKFKSEIYQPSASSSRENKQSEKKKENGTAAALGNGVNGASLGGAETTETPIKYSTDIEVFMEPEDVAAERQRVADYLHAFSSGTLDNNNPEMPAILIHNLRKVFPGKMKKVAVRELALSVSRGEVFGLLGPNGAGKSTTLNILTGFLTPTSGTALVQGYDIHTDMDEVYGIMGVCPQDNLLWDRLTAHEHLSFYGRLKALEGAELESAIESGLRSVNLWNGGVKDKQVRAFSGGMKRRLSVAISLIGNPQCVYLDEPSTGLDPSSRQNLWSVIKAAKPGRGIILTTHSMEEAAALCDRLGIFVDGHLVCLGAPKELTSRYGGYLVYTVTMAPGQEAAVDSLVKSMSPTAKMTYAVGNTRKYELPTDEVSISTVFATMEKAVQSNTVKVLDWGVANATLEEVFIKFAKSIGAEGGN